MLVQKYRDMLGNKSVIRSLSEFATARGREIGYENVFDYSLGNPSVPVPQEFTDTMIRLLQSELGNNFRQGKDRSVSGEAFRAPLSGGAHLSHIRCGGGDRPCGALRDRAGGRGIDLCTLFSGVRTVYQSDRSKIESRPGGYKELSDPF